MLTRDVERVTLTALLADYAQRLADSRRDTLAATQRAERAERLVDELQTELRARTIKDLEGDENG